MPWNLTRYDGNGDLHFITCSCYWRQPLLGSARRRDLFLTVLEQVRLRYQFVVLGYVVMPEHFHLLISEPGHLGFQKFSIIHTFAVPAPPKMARWRPSGEGRPQTKASLPLNCHRTWALPRKSMYRS